MSASSLIERAVADLGAVDLGNGRYALFMGVDDPQHWLITDEYDLVRATFTDNDFKNTVRVEAPWWTPQGQVYCNACKHVSDHTDQACYCSAPCGCDDCGGYNEQQVVNGLHPCCCDSTALDKGQLVTVDPRTGKEIPA